MNIIFKNSDEAIDLLKNFTIENTLYVIDKELIDAYNFDIPHLPIDINLCGVSNATYKDFKYYTISNQNNLLMAFREFTTLSYFNLIRSTEWKNIIFIVKNFTKEFKNAWKYFLRRSERMEYVIPNLIILYDKITSDIRESDYRYFNCIESTNINELYTHLFSHYQYKGTIDYALASHFYNIREIGEVRTEYIFNEESDNYFNLTYLDEYFKVFKLEDENKIRSALAKNEDMEKYKKFERTYKLFTRNMKLLKENFVDYENLLLRNNLLSANVKENKLVYFINSEENFRGKNIEKLDMHIDRTSIFAENAFTLLLKILTGFKQIYELNGIRLKNFTHNIKVNTIVKEGEERKEATNAEEIYNWYLKEGYQSHVQKKEVKYEVEMKIPNLLEGGEIEYVGKGGSKKEAKNIASLWFLNDLISKGILNETYQFTEKMFTLFEQSVREKFDCDMENKNDDIRTILNQIDEEERNSLFVEPVSLSAILKYFTVREIHLKSLNRSPLIDRNFYAEKIILHKEKEEIFTKEFSSTVYLYCNRKYLKVDDCTDPIDEYKVEGVVSTFLNIKNHSHILAIGLSEDVMIETEDIAFLQAVNVNRSQLDYLRSISSLIYNYRKNTDIVENVNPSYNYLIVPVILTGKGELCVEYFYQLTCKLTEQKIMHSSSIFSYKNLHEIDLFYKFVMQKTDMLDGKNDIINFDKFAGKLYNACKSKEEQPVFKLDQLRESEGTSMVKKCEMINGTMFYTLADFLIHFNMRPLTEEQYNLLRSTIGSIIFTYKVYQFIKNEKLIPEQQKEVPVQQKRKRKTNFYKKSNVKIAPEPQPAMKNTKQLIDLLRMTFNNKKADKGQSYDQLEFIGDCFLKFNIATELTKNFFYLISSIKKSNFKFGEYIKEMTGLSFSEQVKILHNHNIEKINPLKILIAAKSYFISNLIFKNYAHNMKLNLHIANEEDIEQPRPVSLSIKKEYTGAVDEDDCLYEYMGKINEDLKPVINEKMDVKINFSVKKTGRVRAELLAGSKEISDIYEAVVGSYFLFGGISMVEKNILKKDFYENRNSQFQEIMILFFNDKLQEIFSKKFNVENRITVTEKIENIHSFDGIFPSGELEAVENIFNYKFKNRAFLENALIHPSYSMEKNYSIDDPVCIFSRNAPFEIFEFVGDGVIDLFVMESLYARGKYPYGSVTENYVDFENIPCEDLHLYKAKHVCNVSLAKVLVKLNLHKYIKNCLSPEEIEMCTQMDISDRSSIFNNYTKLFNEEDIKEIVREKSSDSSENKIRKASLKKFGDMFEALVGAVFVDCDFNYEKVKNAIPGVLNMILK